jgi:hypothetical protein
MIDNSPNPFFASSSRDKRQLKETVPRRGDGRHAIQFAGRRNHNKGCRIASAYRMMEIEMPKANDLEGPQDMGGKHGGQAGMPKPEGRTGAQHGIVKDEKGQEQPADKARAQQSSGSDREVPERKP